MFSLVASLSHFPWLSIVVSKSYHNTQVHLNSVSYDDVVMSNHNTFRKHLDTWGEQIVLVQIPSICSFSSDESFPPVHKTSPSHGNCRWLNFLCVLLWKQEVPVTIVPSWIPDQIHGIWHQLLLPHIPGEDNPVGVCRWWESEDKWVVISSGYDWFEEWLLLVIHLSSHKRLIYGRIEVQWTIDMNHKMKISQVVISCIMLDFFCW